MWNFKTKSNKRGDMTISNSHLWEKISVLVARVYYYFKTSLMWQTERITSKLDKMHSSIPSPESIKYTPAE